MASSQHGRKVGAKLPPTTTTTFTDPARFMYNHQKHCGGSFKQTYSSGNTELFQCPLCKSTYQKTWRTYNQFKFNGELIHLKSNNPIQPENTTNA